MLCASNYFHCSSNYNHLDSDHNRLEITCIRFLTGSLFSFTFIIAVAVIVIAMIKIFFIVTITIFKSESDLCLTKVSPRSSSSWVSSELEIVCWLRKQPDTNPRRFVYIFLYFFSTQPHAIGPQQCLRLKAHREHSQTLTDHSHRPLSKNIQKAEQNITVLQR